jgi:hypothetical protein
MVRSVVHWRRSDQSGEKSPLVLKEAAPSEAVGALVEAAQQDSCPLEELTPTRYAAIRLRHPELGLPKHSTIARTLGGWQAALDQASGFPS